MNTLAANLQLVVYEGIRINWLIIHTYHLCVIWIEFQYISKFWKMKKTEDAATKSDSWRPRVGKKGFPSYNFHIYDTHISVK